MFFSLLDHISELRTVIVHKPNMAEHSLLIVSTVTFSLENAHPKPNDLCNQGLFDKSVHNLPSSPELLSSFTMLRKTAKIKILRYLEV